MTEQDRLEALIDLNLLDSPPEKEFDDLVCLASAICGAPISLVSLVDEHRQWFKASVGMPVRETHRDLSFCSHAIQQADLFVVEDATADPRFQNNGLVISTPHIRFYAGMPLQAPGGALIGALCVIDTVPRRLDPGQEEALRILGIQVQARMELRHKQEKLLQKQRELELSLERNSQLCNSLKAKNDLFLSFMSNGPFAGYVKDADGTMVFYNRYLAQMSGVSEQAWLGLKDHEIWPPDIAAKMREDDLAALEGGEPVESEDIFSSRVGSLMYWRSFRFPFTAEDGEQKLAGISIDVTRDVMREAELENALRATDLLADQLEASQHMFRSFMEHSPTHAWVKDAEGRFVFYNQAAAKFFGITPTEWLGHSVREVLPETEARLLEAQDENVSGNGPYLERVDDVPNKAGKIHKLRSVGFSYKDLSGQTMFAKISEDVTERVRQAEALSKAHVQLELIATTDFLTGLATRRALDSRASVEFVQWKRYADPFSILVMDVDNFKQRNDLYGHAVGDEALALIGKVLTSCLRSSDFASRMGGEEFCVLLPHTNISGAMDVARRFQLSLREEEHGPLPLTVSIGVSAATDECATWEHLLSCADEAMYFAKRTGKNRVEMYCSLHNAKEHLLPPEISAVA